MGSEIDLQEGYVLHKLLAEAPNDIILKTDQYGFITYASATFERLGRPIAEGLFGPHISELSPPKFAQDLLELHRAALHGTQRMDWSEIPLALDGGKAAWFDVQMRRLVDQSNRPYGVIGMMRGADDRRSRQEELFAAEMSDPLTGLTNRRAFLAMLGHLIDHDIPSQLAVFELENFRSANLRFGTAFGDAVLITFANLLRELVRSSDIISRIGDKNLAVLLPGASSEQAFDVSQRIVEALSEARRNISRGEYIIAANAGIAPIKKSPDDTLKRSELALLLAKAKGANCVEISEALRKFEARIAPQLN